MLVITGIFPPDIGGPATYVPQIANALAERGHRVTVLTLSDCIDHEGRKYSFAVVRLPRQMFKPWRWLRTVAEIIRLGRDADVLFVNGLAMEAVLTNYLLRTPMIQKVVGDLAWEQATNRGWTTDGFETFQKQRHGFKVEALKALRSWWTRRADAVIVPSHYLARWVTQWGIPEGKITVIHNAVEAANGILPAEVPVPASVRLVTVGRLIPLKCIDRLIELIGHLDGVGLVVIGDGPERQRLEAMALALGVRDRVHFAGQKRQQQALAVMAACDVLVLNSTHEGFPHVILEAMGLGLPVVATAVGGIPEIVRHGENGLLIPPSNDQALFDTLWSLISSRSERERLSVGVKLASERFSFRRMVEMTESVFHDSIEYRGTR